MKAVCELPRIVIHLDLEDAPRLFIDSASLDQECRLAAWLADHPGELQVYFDFALEQILQRCADANPADLGRAE